MLSQGAQKKKKSLLVSPSHPENITAKITHWPHWHHIHLCGAPAPTLDVGTKFTFHTLGLKAFITPPPPQEPFFHLCLRACCCPSPSLISPVVSLPPINHRWESTRNIVREREQRASAPGGHEWEQQWQTDKLHVGSGRQAHLRCCTSPRLEVKRPNLSSATNFQKWASHIPLLLPPFLKNEEGGSEYIWCLLCFASLETKSWSEIPGNLGALQTASVRLKHCVRQNKQRSQLALWGGMIVLKETTVQILALHTRPLRSLSSSEK